MGAPLPGFGGQRPRGNMTSGTQNQETFNRPGPSRLGPSRLGTDGPIPLRDHRPLKTAASMSNMNGLRCLPDFPFEPIRLNQDSPYPVIAPKGAPNPSRPVAPSECTSLHLDTDIFLIGSQNYGDRDSRSSRSCTISTTSSYSGGSSRMKAGMHPKPPQPGFMPHLKSQSTMGVSSRNNYPHSRKFVFRPEDFLDPPSMPYAAMPRRCASNDQLRANYKSSSPSQNPQGSNFAGRSGLAQPPFNTSQHAIGNISNAFQRPGMPAGSPLATQDPELMEMKADAFTVLQTVGGYGNVPAPAEVEPKKKQSFFGKLKGLGKNKGGKK